MSVNSYLSDMASRLVLNWEEENSISTSIEALSSRLERYFGTDIVKHFQFGSSTRGTILPRQADSNSDIDYMIVFKTYPNQIFKPQTYLNKLKNFAEGRYFRSEIHQSSPTIVLSLNHINFELVPAVVGGTGYNIPAPSSSWQEWMLTFPFEDKIQLQNKNVENGSKIKPLVRLVKYWNACKNYPLSSYCIEQSIIGQYFSPSMSLSECFFSFWKEFNLPYDAPQSISRHVERAKEDAKDASLFESIGRYRDAECEIMKVVPQL